MAKTNAPKRTARPIITAVQELRFGEDDQPKDSVGKAQNSSKKRKRAERQTAAIANQDGDDEPVVTRKDTAKKVEKPVMVMAVDCGMTYSGGGFCAQTSNPEYVLCNKQWPGSTENCSKIPTVIAYKSENPEHHSFQENHAPDSLFGCEVDTEMVTHAFFKTCVDDRADRTVYDDSVMDGEAADALLKVTKGIVGVKAVEDSLRHIRVYLTNKLIDELGNNALDKYVLKTVVTHPAACSDIGRAKMNNAAHIAGFIRPRTGDSIVLKSEAEAACLAAFMTNRRKFGSVAWADDHRAGNGVAVADLGGLTFDVTVLRIKNVEPRLRLEQVCVSQGGRCGTTALYCRLWEHVEAMFGKPFASLPTKLVGHGSPFLTDFERELRRFDGRNLDKEIHLRLLIEDFEHDRYDDVDAMVILDGHEIKSMMDSTLEFLKSVLREQIENAEKENTKVKTIIFCGGGSCFPYLASRLREFCEDSQSGRKEFIRPDDPQSMVATGALIAGLKERIMGKRKCRAWYGIKCHKALRDEPREVWNEADIFECPYGGTRVDGFAKWHIRKGDIIDLSKPDIGNVIPGYVMMKLADLDNDTEYSVKIYSYTGDDEPERVDHPGVTVQGEFRVKPSSMSTTMKAKLRSMPAVKKVSKVDVKMMQLNNVECGLLMIEARVGNTRIGRYQLTFDATLQA